MVNLAITKLGWVLNYKLRFVFTKIRLNFHEILEVSAGYNII